MRKQPRMELKRKIQKWSEREVRAIAKALRVPFAVDRQRAREILASGGTSFRSSSEMQKHVPPKFPFARIWRADNSTSLQAA